MLLDITCHPALCADKVSTGLMSNSNVSAKVVYPDISKMVIYDPRQKSGMWFLFMIHTHTHTHILHFIIFYLAVYGYDDVASFERVGDNMGIIHQLIN